MRLLATTLLILATVCPAASQEVPRDTAGAVVLPPVFVTATRSEKALQEVAVPTTLVTAAAIRARGALRLSDVLAEETGLMLFHDHGTGIQLQGFDPAYTLILIDGDPVIGRTAGTLDLDRLSVADVERVEVVRGPSSSLYGSEALAGVINIITRAPQERLDGWVATRFETHGTTSLAGEGALRRERLGLRLTVDRYGSDGYDLTPATPSATAPRFTDYTLSGRIDFDAAPRTDLRLDARLATQDQHNRAVLQREDADVAAGDRAGRTDWSLASRVRHRFAKGMVLNGKVYAARYRTRMELTAEDDGALLDLSRFDQFYGKGEAQLDVVPSLKHLVTAGGGYVLESVEADRIRGDRQRMNSFFSFVQHEFLPDEWLDLVTSVRIDVHSAYGVHVSPKVAALVRPAGRLRLRASVGSGFKAPTFQQLYMDFTNATVGYSVYGAVGAGEVLRRLEAEGQIVRLLTDPDALTDLRPESSVAVNAGVETEPFGWMEVRLNAFHNEVRDLIEAAPVAVRANGQSAFTYFNLNRIFTRGAEAEVAVRPVGGVMVALGYQLLEAKDRDVLAAIDAGTLFKRVDGRDRRVTRKDYGGLMNRSRHALTLRFQYERPGFTAAVRGLYRSRYGFGDFNGNLILDDASEYVPGYWLWHATLTKNLSARLSVQAGVKNLFDETNPERIPSLPGRLLFAGLRLDL